MDKILETLSKTPLFQGLDKAHLDKLAAITIPKEFSKGSMVFFEGDEGNGFYTVCSGRVKVFKNSSEGKEKILHIIEPGQPFGEVAVFSGKSFPANAEALMQTSLLFFSRQEFIRVISDNPSLSLNMMALLTQRLKQFADQIENLSLKEVPARLAHYLLYLTEEQQSSENIRLTITKGQLASMLGTIPETLSRILAKMQTQKLIEVNGKQIVISNLEELEYLAESGRFNGD
ncbi:MAG: Crp/Fnr family transcriptional regulator [Proteobacteria bacterium]|nr:Crp/Fnr family transcriptional regulator [Pseudomonadota bacterium]